MRVELAVPDPAARECTATCDVVLITSCGDDVYRRGARLPKAKRLAFVTAPDPIERAPEFTPHLPAPVHSYVPWDGDGPVAIVDGELVMLDKAQDFAEDGTDRSSTSVLDAVPDGPGDFQDIPEEEESYSTDTSGASVTELMDVSEIPTEPTVRAVEPIVVQQSHTMVQDGLQYVIDTTITVLPAVAAAVPRQTTGAPTATAVTPNAPAAPVVERVLACAAQLATARADEPTDKRAEPAQCAANAAPPAGGQPSAVGEPWPVEQPAGTQSACAGDEAAESEIAAGPFVGFADASGGGSAASTDEASRPVQDGGDDGPCFGAPYQPRRDAGGVTSARPFGSRRPARRPAPRRPVRSGGARRPSSSFDPFVSGGRS